MLLQAVNALDADPRSPTVIQRTQAIATVVCALYLRELIDRSEAEIVIDPDDDETPPQRPQVPW